MSTNLFKLKGKIALIIARIYGLRKAMAIGLGDAGATLNGGTGQLEQTGNTSKGLKVLLKVYK